MDGLSRTEYHPDSVSFSNQYLADGTLIDDNIVYRSIQEVTDDFYETEEASLWLEYASIVNNAIYTIPVLPTSATHLLTVFYDGLAYIVEGEDISAQEYENGDRVCLVSENFANRNGISPGDALRLPLYFSNHSVSPVYWFIEPDPGYAGHPRAVRWEIEAPLNDDGVPYEVFSDHEYIVKGIYSGPAWADSLFELGANTVIVPTASIRESDEDNIIAYGRMMHATTSFQIPNGSIESFMENWYKVGVDELEIEFRDRGYTKLQQGLDNMKRVSLLFLIIGAAMALALLFYFCYVFISQNKMRTAIERMLGYTKRQCAASLLSGFLLVAIIAIVIGCAAGMLVEGRITDSLKGEQQYDTTYSMGVTDEGEAELELVSISSLYSPASGAALLLATALISAAFVRAGIKHEPLLLLGSKNE